MKSIHKFFKNILIFSLIFSSTLFFANSANAATESKCLNTPKTIPEQNLCFIDFSDMAPPINDETSSGQDFSVLIPGGYIMNFKMNINTMYALDNSYYTTTTTTPIFNAVLPLSSSGAFAMNYGFSSDQKVTFSHRSGINPAIPNSATMNANDPMVTFNFSDINITNLSGDAVNNWTILIADAENTDGKEAFVVNSNTILDLFTVLERTDASSPYCSTANLGIGTNSVTCTGENIATPGHNSIVLKTSNSTDVSILSLSGNYSLNSGLWRHNGTEKWALGVDIKSLPYNVDFNTNSDDKNPSSQLVNDGDNAKKPEVNPLKPGSLFEYWYICSDKSQVEYNFANPVADNISLCAKWKTDTIPDAPKTGIKLNQLSYISVFTLIILAGIFAKISKAFK